MSVPLIISALMAGSRDVNMYDVVPRTVLPRRDTLSTRNLLSQGTALSARDKGTPSARDAHPQGTEKSL
ncbi:hypothetical protein DSM101010T_14170 [Desulfovibrio subterraneus]|uniref:Uncharacterized protein n=1 Tax=Desulfovibrio subterraneus TaxID=2718620 RepID=A0A7J0BIJ2_9BACT|nr:hypothetical protein DSM101010T_14170 [Desulfovibrio subterraneus]